MMCIAQFKHESILFGSYPNPHATSGDDTEMFNEITYRVNNESLGIAPLMEAYLECYR